MPTILLRFWPHLTIAIIGFIIGAWFMHQIEKRDYDRLQLEYTQYQQKAAEAYAEAIERARQAEREQSERAQEIERSKLEKDKRISALERDVLARVRDVRLCNATRSRQGSANVPQADRSSSDPSTAAGEELPSTVIGNLVTLAADADRVMNQLESCQDFARSLQ